MEQKFIDDAERHHGLGPNYFAARAEAERFMASFQAEHFAPMIKKMAEEFHTKMQEDLEDHLLSDVECNLHTKMWHQIDESVKALLSGEKWALTKYALGARYECDKIREAIARHIPAELQDARIADLEAEIERLRKDNEVYRRR